MDSNKGKSGWAWDIKTDTYWPEDCDYMRLPSEERCLMSQDAMLAYRHSALLDAKNRGILPVSNG